LFGVAIESIVLHPNHNLILAAMCTLLLQMVHSNLANNRLTGTIPDSIGMYRAAITMYVTCMHIIIINHQPTTLTTNLNIDDTLPAVHAAKRSEQ
jgi:hypothetical protein